MLRGTENQDFRTPMKELKNQGRGGGHGSVETVPALGGDPSLALFLSQRSAISVRLGCISVALGGRSSQICHEGWDKYRPTPKILEKKSYPPLFWTGLTLVLSFVELRELPERCSDLSNKLPETVFCNLMPIERVIMRRNGKFRQS
jgi:hypothetical protein